MMNKRRWPVLCLLFPLLFLSACRDSPDKLIKDAHDVLDKMEMVLLDLEQGKISSSEAVEELKEVHEELAAFQGRYERMEEEGTLNEKDPEWKRESNEVEAKADKIRMLVEKLESTGKMTPDLEKVLEEF